MGHGLTVLGATAFSHAVPPLVMQNGLLLQSVAFVDILASVHLLYSLLSVQYVDSQAQCGMVSQIPALFMSEQLFVVQMVPTQSHQYFESQSVESDDDVGHMSALPGDTGQMRKMQNERKPCFFIFIFLITELLSIFAALLLSIIFL